MYEKTQELFSPVGNKAPSQGEGDFVRVPPCEVADRLGSERLIDQMELAFAELEERAAVDERQAQIAAAKTATVQGFARKRTPRSFPDHLPRERVVVPAADHCSCWGSRGLSKLGENITSPLEKVPARMKLIETVRDRFSCRNCETITQPPAPFHVMPRGMFGPHLLASILFDNYGMHQPLNRQRDRYAREGVEIALSTLAVDSDYVGAGMVALRPLLMLMDAHGFAAERLRGNDTTISVQAKGKTDTGRIGGYVRDDEPFGGEAPPVALFITRVTAKDDIRMRSGQLQRHSPGGHLCRL